MKTYIDLCVYNRVFDDQTQPRIMMEALGFIIIMALVSSGDIEILNSFVLEYENSKNPRSENRIVVGDMLRQATRLITYDQNIQDLAEEFEGYGVMGIDALHLSCAHAAGADFFITCDDVLIRKAQKIKGLSEFVKENNTRNYIFSY